MKYIKHRFAKSIIFFLKPCLFFICVSFITACDSVDGLEPHEYIEKAKGYMLEGEVMSSIIELKNALQKEASLPEARWLLGQAYLKIENGSAAYKEFEQALMLGYDDPAFEVVMVKSLLLSGKFDEVISKTSNLTVKDSNYALLIALRGDAQLSQRQLDKALFSYKLALSSDNASFRARLGLARVMLLQKKLVEAGQYLDEAKQLSTEDENVWVLLGQLAFMQGKYGDSKQAFLKAIELSKYNVRTRLGLVPVLFALKEYALIQQHLQVVEKMYPNHPMLKYYQAYIALQAEDTETPKEILRNNLQKFPTHSESLFLLGQILYKENNLEQSKGLLLKLVNIAPDNLSGIKLLASIQFKQKQTNEAVITLEKALKIEPNDSQLLLLLGSAYISSGELERGSQLLEKATKLKPESAGMHTQFAFGLLAVGDTERAVSELNAAIALAPNELRANILLFMTHMRSNEFDAAITVANQLFENQPDNPVPHNLLGAAYVGKGENEAAMREYEQALELKADFTPAMANLAKLHIKQGNIKRAEQRYRDILDVDQNNIEALISLARIEAEQNNTDKMAKLLQQARKANITSLEPRLLLGKYYYQLGDLNNLFDVVNEAVALSPDNPQAVMLLAQAQRLARNNHKALSTLEALLKVYPDNVDVLIEMSQVYLNMGNLSAAKPLLDTVLVKQPNHYKASRLAMSLALRRKDYLLAREHFNVIKQAFPDKKELGQLDGRILFQEGKIEKAINAFEKALEVNETQAVTAQLAEAYLANGNQVQASSVLNDWIENHENNSQAQLLLASIYLQQQKYGQAIDLHKQLLDKHPKHVVAMNNLAWLYFESDDLEQASILAQKAYELAPESPEVADTLGWLMIQQGKTESGLELLDGAHKAAPESADIHYHMAAALAAAGDKTRALIELNTLLKNHNTFSERDKAEKLLKSIQ